MALTYWSEGKASETGNLETTTQYYELDLREVMSQPGAAEIGLLHFMFRDKPTTVYAAKDKDKNILPLVALPCPPWYHEDVQEAFPTNIILGEGI